MQLYNYVTRCSDNLKVSHRQTKAKANEETFTLPGGLIAFRLSCRPSTWIVCQLLMRNWVQQGSNKRWVLLGADRRGQKRVEQTAYVWVPRWRKQRWNETVRVAVEGLYATAACPLWALGPERRARGSSDVLSGRGIMLDDMCTVPGCSP